MSSELATIPTNDLPQLSVAQVKHRMESINDLMRSQMTVGVDFGQIPGTNSKPTLLKSGAEKLCVMFMLDPQFNTVKHFTNDGHLTAESTCTIYHAPSGNRLGSASAICSTKESKYAYRKAARKCPTCGAETIIWSNKNTVYMCIGGDKGGCWAKFPKGDKSIEDQPTGRVSNPDLADAYNTVIRIVEKRALVAAVRLVTGASSTFDEPDILTEDADDHEVSHPTKPVVQQSKPTPPAGLDEAIAGLDQHADLDQLIDYCKHQPEPVRLSKQFRDAFAKRRLSLLTTQIDEAAFAAGLGSFEVGMHATEMGIDMETMTGDSALKLLTRLKGLEKKPATV